MLGLVAAPAWAQPADDGSPPAEGALVDDDKERVWSLFREGWELAEARQCDRALPILERSYEMARGESWSWRWRPLYEIAVCQHEIGRHVEAEASYEELRHRHQDLLTEQQRADIDELLREEREHGATLVVGVVVPVCEIRVDGEPRAASPTEDTSASGLLELRLNPGDRRLELRCPGYDHEELTIDELEPGEQREVTVSLREASTEAPALLTTSAWPWTVIGLGAATAAAGGILLGVAASDAATVESAEPGVTTWASVEDANDRAITFSTVGPVLLAGGGVLIASGLVWGLVADGESDGDDGADSAEVALQLRLGGAALTGRF